ncbi:hypothetical protein ACFLSS_02660 [Bacteroidota bacterium]
MKTRILAILLLILGVNAGLFSQSKDPDLILDRVKEAFNQVQDYTVDVHLKIDVEFLKVPESDAKLYYKQPDKVHVESDKFALLPRRGLNFSPLGLISGKYTALYEQEDTIRNIPVSVVKVIPSGSDDDIILSTFWIDENRNLILRVESSRKPSGTFTIDFIYERIDDKFELPSSLEFTFTVDPSMFSRHRDMNINSDDEMDKKKKSGPKTGKVYITFSNYNVNTGLSDELFDEKKTNK